MFYTPKFLVFLSLTLASFSAKATGQCFWSFSEAAEQNPEYVYRCDNPGRVSFCTDRSWDEWYSGACLQVASAAEGREAFQRLTFYETKVADRIEVGAALVPHLLKNNFSLYLSYLHLNWVAISPTTTVTFNASAQEDEPSPNQSSSGNLSLGLSSLNLEEHRVRTKSDNQTVALKIFDEAILLLKNLSDLKTYLGVEKVFLSYDSVLRIPEPMISSSQVLNPVSTAEVLALKNRSLRALVKRYNALTVVIGADLSEPYVFEESTEVLYLRRGTVDF